MKIKTQNNETHSQQQLVPQFSTKQTLNVHHEFIAGFLAATTSICCLFPFNKIIFRQILYNVSVKDAYAQLREEGLSKVYRGMLPPLLQKSISYSIMFGTQHQYYLFFKDYFERNERLRGVMHRSHGDALVHGISALFAGLTEATLTPFERVQSVLQMQKYHNSYKNTFDTFGQLRRNYGTKELYRGFTGIAIRNGLSNTVWFGCRKPFKQLLPVPKTHVEEILHNFLVGGLLGAIVSTIFYPLNVIKSHMQAKVGGEFLSISGTTRILYNSRDRKIVSLFKGVGGNFTRALFAWGITNSAFEFFLNQLKI